MELFNFVTIEIIPVGIRKAKQQSDARPPRHSWGTGQMFQKHTGIASELYWNRLDVFQNIQNNFSEFWKMFAKLK